MEAQEREEDAEENLWQLQRTTVSCSFKGSNISPTFSITDVKRDKHFVS